MGAAIRAAAGDEAEEGFEIFLEWCTRWRDGENDPETVRKDWRGLYPPFAVGWDWIAATARAFACA